MRWPSRVANLSPNTTAAQAAITAQLNALVATVPPGGATVGDGITQPLPAGALFPIETVGTLYLSQINAAIQAAGGIESYDLTAPAADVTFASGHPNRTNHHILMTTTPFNQVTGADFQGRSRTSCRRPGLAASSDGAADRVRRCNRRGAVLRLRQATVQFLDVEADPSRAIALLPDWENDFGLPDSCSPADPTLQQRHASLLAKIASSPGGQSAAYYIGVAAQLGYTITITTFAVSCYGISVYGDPCRGIAWRFAWQVNAPEITVQCAEYGSSAYGDPFWTISDTELECRLSKIQPAYGVLWFQFG